MTKRPTAARALPLLALVPGALAAQDERGRPNLLLITADDLNRSSVGCYGCAVDGATPHIDALAEQGVRFARAHVTIAVCQPCRSVWMTGRYPHRNGAEGFEPIDAAVPTLTERLREAGYLNGILGKVRHLAPRREFAWDRVVTVGELGRGRDPARYHAATRAFLRAAKRAGRPFFLMANSHDPHRPFAGSRQEERVERRRGGEPFPPAPRTYRPEEVEVPGFLPDIPDVRAEVAQYFSSVHRCDATVGAVLRALEQEGLAERTVVLFTSDHGMAFPFAKTNCYANSTRVPLVVRWPGVVEPGAVDAEHLVSGIDLMPTLLEIAGAPPVEGVDGRSFVALLRGERQADRDRLVTVFHETAAGRRYPMRCVHSGRFGYLFNAWSDGRTVFRNESQSGLTFRAMRRAAEDDPAIAARVELFLYRVPEELYDFASDPDARRNLIDSEEHAEVRAELRGELRAWMEETGDPLLERFLDRVGG